MNIHEYQAKELFEKFYVTLVQLRIATQNPKTPPIIDQIQSMKILNLIVQLYNINPFAKKLDGISSKF
jgi:succinyl-CoA synthetase beta subunit